MSFYCSFHKVVHFCVHHAAGLTVTATVLILAICFVWHEKNCRDNSECMVIRDLSANSLVTLPLNLTALKSSRLSANVVDSVESFVLFLGMDDRMLGRLLNHHPEVAIASGFNLFQRWHFQKSILQKKSLLLTLLVSNHPNVLNSKEGATHKLTIVGDYSSLSMTALCTTSPIYCCHVCSQLQETLRTPLKFVQVRSVSSLEHSGYLLLCAVSVAAGGFVDFIHSVGPIAALYQTQLCTCIMCPVSNSMIKGDVHMINVKANLYTLESKRASCNTVE